MPNALASSVSAVTGQAPSVAAGGLAGQAAAQNIAAAPSLDTLAQLISGINQRAYLSAPGRQTQVGNIQNELAGNLDPQTIQAAQLGAAQRYGSAGFGADSGAWQSAVQRATGISREALKARGSTDLNALYAGMPVTDASRFAVTPELLQQQQQAAAQLSEQSREFNVSTAQGQAQFVASLEEKAREANQQAAATSSALSEQQREYDLTHSASVAQEIARLQEQAREANQNAQLESTKLQMAGQQFAQSQAQQQDQFTATLGQRATEFGATQGLDFAKLYAQLYGGLPGYSSTGQYTGILGGSTGTGTTPMPNNLAFPPFNTAPGGTATTPRITLPAVTTMFSGSQPAFTFPPYGTHP